ncbi:MAG: sigma-70 family RNA polymerase sigma factor [Granulosicoccus sp.]
MSQLHSNEQLIALLERSASGDQFAFRELYEHCSPQLFGVLLRIVKQHALAEEALQEVFVRIWQRSKQYESDKGEPVVWMTSIARYHAIDVLRKRKLREAKESSLSPVDSDIIPESDVRPMELLLDQQLALTHCLDRLEEKPRECVIRAYCEGYTADELGVMLEKPVGTVKSWIRRSLLSLKECLDGLR